MAFLMDKLKTNGFQVRYIHPNMLFISWMHWIPGYIRNEIKKKTGIAVNEYGVQIEEKDQEEDKMIEYNPNDYMLKQNNDLNQKSKTQKKEYTPIKSYKPSGNLVYDDDILNRIENKFT